MRKKMLAALLAGVMVASGFSGTALAEETVTAEEMTVVTAEVVENYLKEGHKGYAGNDFTSLGDFILYNPLGLNVNKNDPYADFSFWHFVDSSAVAEHAEITFEKPDGTTETWTVSTTCNASGKYGHHYAVITPSDWKLAGGVSYSAAAGEFNLSHSGRHEAELGKVVVNASAAPWHTAITPHEYYERTVDEYYERAADEYYERTVDKYYERTVDEYYERTVDEYYERTVDKYYERTVDEFYERPVTDIYQRYAQRYLIPVFEKKLAGAYDDTLVTRLEYSDNTAKATPVNGGAFKNGHTYVTVDVAKASKEGGVWYTIADSSKNNGKKTPDQYNRPIDYQYNVTIKDGKLTVSCGGDLAYAGVGAEIWATAPKDFKNAPKHYAGSVTVDVPKNKGTVDLYVHFGKLGWYEVDENGNFVYQFKEWRYDGSRTEYDEEYTKIDTIYGDYALVETKYGEYELADTVYGDYVLENTVYGEYELADTKYGDYELVNTEYGEYELAGTEYGEYELVNTVYGEYGLVKTEEIRETVQDTYTGTLTLTVTDANGISTVKPLNEELELEPGVYTFTITGSGTEFAPVSKEVTIARGANDTVTFETIVYQNPDVTLDTVEHHADKEATEHYTTLEAEKHYADKAATEHHKDLEAEKHYADKAATEHFADKAATEHHKDLPAEKHYNDKKTDPIYKEEYLYKEDIKLGNEEDAFGEYAVRLN